MINSPVVPLRHALAVAAALVCAVRGRAQARPAGGSTSRCAARR